MSDYQYSTYRDGEYVSVPPIDELCLALKEKFLRQEEKIKKLQEENKYIKSKEYATTELANMEKQLKEMQREYYNGFPITDEERKNIDEWKAEHEKTVHSQSTKFYGPIGGQYTYYFIPTSIGTAGYVKCSCGAKYKFQEIG